MPERVYPFEIGAIHCISVSDGAGMISSFEEVQGMFPDVSSADLHPALENLSGQEWEFGYNPLYIHTGPHHVLIDTGHGPASAGHGHLVERLGNLGVSTDAIDIVFITHAHGDHVEGLANTDSSLMFPNARYVIAKREWDFWMGEAASKAIHPDYLGHVRSKLALMEHALTLIEPGESIAPGLTAVGAFGHTPGHMAVLVESEGQRLLQIADTVHIPFQIAHLDWSPHFDSDKTASPAVRRRLFAQAAEENMLVHAFHFPFPALGHITQDGDSFVWRPVA